jgi:hypothetical protein
LGAIARKQPLELIHYNQYVLMPQYLEQRFTRIRPNVFVELLSQLRDGTGFESKRQVKEESQDPFRRIGLRLHWVQASGSSRRD